MRTLIKRLIVILVLSLLVLPVYASEKLKVGDYVEFGSYLNRPIKWIVIDFDEKGNPLLHSEKVITIKSYDAPGDKYTDIDRRNAGGNDWENSTLRQWLNSKEERVVWKFNEPPSIDSLPVARSNYHSWNQFQYNSYKEEKGFLADGNFQNAERELVLPKKHKVHLSPIDIHKRSGGKELLKPELDSGRQNGLEKNWHDKILGKDVYYHEVIDSIFILSMDEYRSYYFMYPDHYAYATKEAFMQNWVDEKGNPIFSAFSGRFLISQSLAQKDSDYSFYSQYYDDNSQFISENTSQTVSYWLRTPAYGSFMTSIGGICSYIDATSAFDSNGVRPALYLKGNDIEIKSGLGLDVQPYKIQKKGKSTAKVKANITKVSSRFNVNINDTVISSNEIIVKSNIVYIPIRKFVESIGGKLTLSGVTYDGNSRPQREGQIDVSGFSFPIRLTNNYDSDKDTIFDSLMVSYGPVNPSIEPNTIYWDYTKGLLECRYMKPIYKQNTYYIPLLQSKHDFQMYVHQTLYEALKISIVIDEIK